MRRAARLVAVVCAVVPAACGGEPAAPQPQLADDGPRARLVIEQRRAADSAVPPEGSFGFFEVRTEAPQPVISGNLPTTERTTLYDGPVPAGEYTIVSYQRACAESCRRLELATDTCEGDVALKPDERVEVVITVRHGQGCTVQRR